MVTSKYQRYVNVEKKLEQRFFWFFMGTMAWGQILVLNVIVFLSLAHLEVAGDPKQMLIDALAVTLVVQIDNAVGEYYWRVFVPTSPIGREIFRDDEFLIEKQDPIIYETCR